jgi:hypothetical protein
LANDTVTDNDNVSVTAEGSDTGVDSDTTVDIVTTVLSKLTWVTGPDGKPYLTKGGELGDAMSANAGFAAMFPDDQRVHDYVTNSFAHDKVTGKLRPFRSPVHANEYLSGAMTQDALRRSFSRDHCLSLAWYCLWTNKVWPLQAIAALGWKFGREGTMSQVGMTPNVLWAFNAVASHVARTVGRTDGGAASSPKLPLFARIWPGWLVAVVQLLSALTVPVGYRLNLCSEMALLARLTGRWSWLWKKVAETCARRQMDNLYYRIALHGGQELAAHGGVAELERIVANYAPSHEWLWCWMNRTNDGKLKACGADLLLAYRLLTK